MRVPFATWSAHLINFERWCRGLSQHATLASICCLLVSLASTGAQAEASTEVVQIVRYEILIDGDRRQSTGCEFQSQSGELFRGAEWRLTAVARLDPSPRLITQEVAKCAGSEFLLGQTEALDYPVGLNNGVSLADGRRADVVELAVSRSHLPGIDAQIRIGVVAREQPGSVDVLYSADGNPTGPPLTVGTPQEIPTLGFLTALLLAVGLAVLGVRALRRNRLLAQLLMIGALFSAALAAWAANHVADGLVGDWAGASPVGTDPQGDPQPNLAATDIVAVFGADENRKLHFRIDVVDAENRPPVAVADAFATLEDTALTVPAPGVLGNDTDPDGNPVTAQLVTGPTRGTLTLNPNGSFSYTPNANANGSDSFTYNAFDGQVPSQLPATVTIAITPVNDVPAFTRGADQTVLEDAGAQVVNPWATGIDDGDPEATQALSFEITGNSNAALFNAGPSISPTGVLSYTPAVNANGTAAITLRIRDDGGTANGGVDASATQTFNLTVTAVNDAPTFTAGASQAVNEDAGAQTVAGWATAINDGDPELTQTLSFTTTVTGSSGNLAFTTPPAIDATTGSLTYSAAANTNGVATVEVRLVDNGSNTPPNVNTSAPQSFTITVNAVNDAPVFTAGPSQTVLEDAGPQVVNPWATGIDDGDPELSQTLAFIITANTNPGLFSAGPSVSPTGQLSYTPAANANGSATITLRIEDNGSNTPPNVNTSATQSFTITVTAVNDAPSFTASNPPAVNEDAAAQSIANWASFSPGPADEAGQTVLGYQVSAISNAALFSAQPAVANNGTLSYTPAPNANGTSTFTLRVQDSGGTADTGVDLSAPQTFTITLNAVNDAPVNTVPGAQQTGDSTPLVLSTANANAISVADVDAGTGIVQLSFGTGAPGNGTLTLANPGGVLTTLTGNGTELVIASGTLTAMNAALNGPSGSLTYTPVAGTSAARTLTLISNDQGNTGPGGAQIDTDTITVNVDGPPVVTSTPANGATIASNAAIAVNFSESVNVTAGITLTCGGPNLITGGNTGAGVTSLNLSYAGPLVGSCVLTVPAASVADVDSIDPPNNPVATYIATFTVDTAPTVTTTLPVTGATTANDIDLVVNFSEPATFTAASFALECPAGSPFAGGFAVSGSGTASATINPTGVLPPGGCALTVIATNVLDADAIDPPDAMAANAVLNFSVDAAPAISNREPANGATGLATDANVVYTFSEPVNVNPASFVLECPAGSSRSFTLSGSGTNTITLNPDANLPEGASCSVLAVAAQISDADAFDPPNTLAANDTLGFATDAAPSVSNIVPANGATDVGLASNIVVSFSEPVNFAPGAFSLECPAGNAVPFSVSGSGSATATIDPTPATLPINTLCRFSVNMALVNDVDLGDPPDLLASNVVIAFTTLTEDSPEVLGTTPPGGTFAHPDVELEIQFSEPIDASADSVLLSCNNGPNLITGGINANSARALRPTHTTLPVGNCRLTVRAEGIRDSDLQDPPDGMLRDHIVDFPVAAAPAFISVAPTHVNEGQPYTYRVELESAQSAPPVELLLEHGPPPAAIEGDGRTMRVPLGALPPAAGLTSFRGTCRSAVPQTPPSTFDIAPKWHFNRAAVLMTPLVGRIIDRNGDRVIDDHDPPSLLVSTFPAGSGIDGTVGKLNFIDGSTGRMLGEIPGAVPIAAGQIAYADLNRDGVVEFIYFDRANAVVAVSADGEVLWVNRSVLAPVGSFINGGPTIADLEADGVPEILARNAVINADGSTRWTAPAPVPTYTVPAFFVDEQGRGRVLMLNQALDIHGAVVWQVPLGQGAQSVWFHVIADLDQDRRPEIVYVTRISGTATGTNQLRLYRSDGVEIWSRDLGVGGGSSPAIADVDGDGRLDIILSGVVWAQAFNADGHEMWRLPVANLGSDSVPPTAFDFNGDGRMEVIVTDHLKMQIVDGQTGSVIHVRGNNSRTALETPIVADVNGDGSAELMIASDDFANFGLKAFGGASVPWRPTLPTWNQYEYTVVGGAGPGYQPEDLGLYWRSNPRHRVNQPVLPSTQAQPLADVAIHDVQIVTGPRRVSARVSNRGLANSGPVQVRFESIDGSLLGEESIPNLLPRESRSIEVAVPALNRDVRVNAISENMSMECDVNNNYAIGMLAQLRAQGADGQFARQTWLINVDNVNDRPAIPAQELPAATVGVDWSYQVQVSDPDLGDGIRYEIVTGPVGLSIHPVSGEFHWRAPTSAIGTATVIVRASDLAGATSERALAIVVRANTDNQSPYFVSVPETQVQLNRYYHYLFRAVDPEGEMVSYSLVQGAPDMSIDASLGRVNWFPGISGTYSVRLRACDPHSACTDQTWTLSVAFNRPPVFDSTPVTAADVDQAYVYNAHAVDPDGHPIVYALGRAPVGATIDAHTGSIQWVPAQGDVGSHPVLVWANDSNGAQADQFFTLVVRAANQPPQITSVPVSSAKEGLAYRYDVEATDPDSPSLTYSLQQAPPGMSIAPGTGLIEWTPASPGNVNVRVRVDDGQAWEEQSWTIVVSPANVPLQAQLFVDPVNVVPGAPVAVQVSETGAAGAVVRGLRVDGTPVVLDSSGSATLSSSDFGPHALVATVSDPYASDSVTGEFFVIDASDTTPPVVDLISPIDNAEVTAPTPVRITVTDARLREWRLYFREANSPEAEPNLLAHGASEVTDQIAAEFDPTLLLNGQYTIYLRATDAGGNVGEDSAVVRVTGDMKIGNFSLTFEEVSIPVAGIPVRVSRTYDTRRRNQSLDFGQGWTVDYQNVRVHESRKLGFSWLIREVRDGTITRWCNESNGDRVVTVTLPDGAVESFRAVTVPQCTVAVPEPNVQLAFEPIDGTDSALEQTTYGLLRLQTIAGFPGMMTLIDPSSAEEPVDPSAYVLTTPEGLRYELDQGFGIRRVVDLDGNSLTYSDSGVEHSSGIGIQFERDPLGRIGALVLPDGERIEYGYTSAGDLDWVRDQMDLSTRFAYAHPGAAHYLTQITDARNVPVARNEYDEDGRLIASIDAGGNRIEFDHQIPQRLERVRDRRGHQTTYTYDDNGWVLTETNALNQTITRNYDADGNVRTEQDSLGRVRTMTYDLRGNQETETNGLGQTDTRTYNARNQLLTEVDDLGRVVIDNDYNPLNGALTRTENALGEPTTFGYDSGIGSGETGELTRITDALNRQTTYTLDSAGHGWRIRETDAAGTVTRYTHDGMGRVRTEVRLRTRADGSVVEETTTTSYDAKGRVTRVDQPDGSHTTTEYNAIDKPERECDALSRCTQTTYTPRGEVDRVIHPDGTYEETRYDENGNTVSQRDRGGRVTRMVYDAADRLVETIHPDASPANGDDGNPANNPRVLNQYDAAGQLRYVTDERGNRTEYRYDAAGRQTHVIDALGNTTITAYDDAGQRSSVTDALGRITKFVHDDAGRLIETVHPDQTPGDADNPRTRVEYDAAGQKIADTDEMGRTTRYAFDALGRLERVVLPNPDTGANPPLVNGQSPAGAGTLTTRYVYDERGNKVQQIDALGRITRFEYDSQGRQTARGLPLGQRETMSYNLAGEQTGRVTFNNESIALSYDSVGRPDTITLPDRTRSFSYTTSGQVSQIVDGSDTWRFGYDARDRLVRAEDSFGRAIEYRYDASGNRTELDTCPTTGPCTARQQVDYGYDELNRLRQVVARLDGGVPQTTQYRYDAVGTRSGMTHPNGTVVDYTYDVRNRLKTLVHKASAVASAATLLALSYSVDASGLRTQIAEIRPGDATTPIYTRTTDYQYDAVKRLTREQVTGNHGTPDRIHAWTYDAVGNRLTQVATVGAAPAAVTTTTSYDYDNNDRLLSESAVVGAAPAVVTTSLYDNAGNLTESREGSTTVARYTWDAEGRLTAAVLGNGPTQKSTSYRYDPNGIRRSQVVTDAAGTSRTEYLVDPNQAYAQVLEEWTATAPSGPLPDETLATAYVYGDDLISQTKLALAGASTTSVFHYDGLGTTRALSAHKVDAAGVPQAGHGEITDRYAYTAFGESDPAGTSGDTSGASENNYRYTGEQLDPNLGFYYLRARYMDPGQGRFLGMDPWSGDINTPMSLHRYAYAQGQVANRIDPSGNASRADDLLQALTIQAFLATAATVVIRAIVPIESDRRPDRGVTAADAVAISYFKANIDTSQILAATTTATSMIEDEHHTIPVYICGHPDQDLSRLYRRDHFLIHAQIGAVKFAIERAEDLTTHTFRLGRRRSPEGWLLASTQAGRIAIAGALDAVYVLGGWLTTGSPPIGEIYFGAAGATGEKQKFIAGHTSWPFCVRP